MVSLGAADGEVYLGVGWLRGGVASCRTRASQRLAGNAPRKMARCALVFSQPFRAGLSLCRAYGAPGLRDGRGARVWVTECVFRAGVIQMENFKFEMKATRIPSG